MTETAGWQVGATVVRKFSSIHGTRFGNRAKIEKVYKNGNFVLEGEKGQWRPGYDRAGKAGNYYGSECLVLLTAKVEEEMTKEARVAAARKRIRSELERLEAASRSRDDDLVLSVAASLPSTPNVG